MPVARRDYERFIKASRHNPCPVCGKPDWCGFNSYICSCMRISEGAFKHVILSNGQVAHLHWLEPGRVTFERNREEIIPVAGAELAPIEVRDRVYRSFLRLLYLYPRHQEDLHRRGLDDKEIKRNGYKSVPENEPPWVICRRLINNNGHNLEGIPGFYLAKSQHDGYYWTFDPSPGYFIPIRDSQGRIQALQRRMDDTSNGKYKLFSGHVNKGGCSCGTPAHVARPEEIKDPRVWITEGPLKADIAAAYLDALVIGVAGATSWKPALYVVEELAAKEVVIAYDMDQKSNEAVATAKRMLAAKLKGMGIVVREAVWEARCKNEKGIDDALMVGLEVRVV
ncbi:DUF3854 domain-containing protein [Thermanaeromonas sp.]|uniref:DUF3854 domain-containing protein n=1 Tax=Thermanaeromonas sp. TaxID=2003697 RepID=UPI002628B65E|nr:DUF3854 domain-containing protein [Thermanaeromonas sp.]